MSKKGRLFDSIRALNSIHDAAGDQTLVCPECGATAPFADGDVPCPECGFEFMEVSTEVADAVITECPECGNSQDFSVEPVCTKCGYDTKTMTDGKKKKVNDQATELVCPECGATAPFADGDVPCPECGFEFMKPNEGDVNEIEIDTTGDPELGDAVYRNKKQIKSGRFKLNDSKKVIRVRKGVIVSISDADEVPTELKCPECGATAPFAEGDVPCPECGFEFMEPQTGVLDKGKPKTKKKKVCDQAEELECPSCGATAPFEEGDIVCPECGFEFMEPVELDDEVEVEVEEGEEPALGDSVKRNKIPIKSGRFKLNDSKKVIRVRKGVVVGISDGKGKKPLSASAYAARLDALKKARTNAHTPKAENKRYKTRFQNAQAKVSVDSAGLEKIGDSFRELTQLFLDAKFALKGRMLDAVQIRIAKVICDPILDGNTLTFKVPVYEMHDKALRAKGKIEKISIKLEDGMTTKSIIEAISDNFEVFEKVILDEEGAVLNLFCPECGHTMESDTAESVPCPECGFEFMEVVEE